MLLSVVMCLRESLNQNNAADKLESVIYQLIKEGKTTRDLNGDYNTSDIFNYVKKNL